MEIHAPHGPVLTLREALVHLGIVTIGILIALSLEGLVQWHEHGLLVSETRGRIEREIANNRQELQNALQQVKSQHDRLVQGIDIYESIAERKSPATTSVTFDYPPLRLQTAAYMTGQAVGAFAFMDEAEVARYASVYDLQEKFFEIESRAVADGLEAFSYAQTRDIAKLTAGRLEETGDLLRRALGSNTGERQAGELLLAEYTKNVRARGN
jgi:hypothetical protein